MNAHEAFQPPTELAVDRHAEATDAGVDFADSPFAGPDRPAHRGVFVLGDRVHWHARFGGPAGTVRLDLVTVHVDADGWERVASGTELWLAHPDATEYSGWLDLPAYRTPGWFALRFVRGGEVLAEGAFDVVEPREDPAPIN
jgi:hypothetical protein